MNAFREKAESLPLSGIRPDCDGGSSGRYGLLFYERTVSMV